MTTLTLPFDATATAAKPGFDIGPVARTLVSITCFTMCFFVVIALGRAAFGLVDNLHHYAKLPVIIHVASVLPAIPLGRSDQLRIGDVVLAIGNPYGLSKTVTQGIVSATGRGVLGLLTFENFIQTDAAINEGNSGGALIDTSGQLVGINTAVLTQDASTEGIGFAIPIDLVRGVIEEIKKNGRVIRGWVGIVPDELSRVESAALGLEPNTGIILTSIVERSPADEAGLRRGDVILSINGEVIRSRQQALLIVARLNPGDEVTLEGLRDGRRFRVSLTATERPSL